MDHQSFLDEIVEELLQDTEWELPAELRFPLKAALAWTLLGI